MNKLLLSTVATLGLAIAAVGLESCAAHAEYALWNFSSPTGDIGPSHTYSSSPDGGLITAMAFGPGSPDLFGKDDGPDEQGLGLTGDGEITAGSFVQLDLSGLSGVNQMDALIASSSTAGNDIWQAFACDTSGVMCSNEIAAGFTNAPIAIDLSGHQFLNFTGADCDTIFLGGQCSGNNTVLLASVGAQVAAVPEPATLALFGAGLLGLGWLKRRRSGSRLA